MKVPLPRLRAFRTLLMFFATALLSQNHPILSKRNSQAGPEHAPLATPRLCTSCIRAHMEFLASDALRGRGSGTADELLSATYVASELRAYGVEPTGSDGSYLQRASLIRHKLTAAPKLIFSPSAGTLIYGRDFRVLHLTQPAFSGPLMKVNTDQDMPAFKPGAVVLITGGEKVARQKAFSAAAQGVAGAMVAFPEEPEQFEGEDEGPSLPDLLEDQDPTVSELGRNRNVLELSAAAARLLGNVPDGTILHFEGPATTERGNVWNTVGILRGSDPKLRDSAVLFSAHLDHLGIGKPINGDNIYNGADDDASGVTAVLELARVLCAGPRPRRTVIFALFGGEEIGELGSTYFSQHPPLSLAQIATNLEIEMVGRPDPSVPDDELWLTGWRRSNLGPVLAAHGARLVGDPRPEQNFFRRSDNYILAKKGVVAQTISSYGLHGDYHKPSDDLAHIDFKHMNAALGSLLRSVEWLVNSAFVPKWNEGGRP